MRCELEGFLLRGLPAGFPKRTEFRFFPADDLRKQTGFAPPFVFIPMCKGDGGFVSDRQFGRFCRPASRKPLPGFADEGLIPFMVMDGSSVVLNISKIFREDPSFGPSGRRTWLSQSGPSRSGLYSRERDGLVFVYPADLLMRSSRPRKSTGCTGEHPASRC
jgi:hypothetical protein